MITCKNNFGEMVTLPKEKFQFRPSIYGIIKNSGKICVCRNKSNGKIWFPGGGIDKGEKMTEALLREIKEEAGLQNVQIGNLLGTFENFFYYQPTDEAMHAFLFFYECSTEEIALLSDDLVNDEEARGFHWINISQFEKDDLGDLNEELFKIINSLQ